MGDYQINTSDNQIYQGIIFVTGGNDCWINIQEGQGEIEKIEIECDNLVDKLLDDVPCRVGGNYLYEERAEISARMKKIDSKKVLVNLHRIKIVRDDQEYEVIL